MNFDAGGGSEKLRDFTGRISRYHIDGRHIYVQFDHLLKDGDREFDVGWYDVAKTSAPLRKGLKDCTKVKGKAEITGSNLPVIQTLEKIPRERLITVIRNMFTRRPANARSEVRY